MNLDILIFDMDGVLIDVSGSYRKTIQKTVQIYLNSCFGFDLKGKDPFSDEEISLFKMVGGFNNDWDLTSAIILYLLSISDIPPLKKRKNFSNISDIITFLNEKASKYKLDPINLFKRKKTSHFLKLVKSFGGGLRGIRIALKNSWEGWVYRSGDLDKENVIKRIFQEVYLGKQFSLLYNLDPIFYNKKGLYIQERLLISKKILQGLRKYIKIGIASGRPRFEAELALKRFQILSYFDSLVTLDDCKEEEDRIFRSTGKRLNLAKPHPYSILKAVQEIGIHNPRCGYIGDVLDDMISANLAKKHIDIQAIGFLKKQKYQKSIEDSLIKAGADYIIREPNEIITLFRIH